MNVLVTGGGLRVPIDAVREITNFSTGRFSAELTEAFLRRGAEVWHVHAHDALLPFQHRARFDLECQDSRAEHERIDHVRQEFVRSKNRLHGISVRFLDEYERCLAKLLTEMPFDIVILAMAVPDYQVEATAGKVSSNLDEWILKLRPTPKVIQHVRAWAPEVFLTGFKLLVSVSAEELIETARLACIKNRADLTVANDLTLKELRKHTVHLVNDKGLIHTLKSEELSVPMAEPLADLILEQYALRDRGGNP